MTKVIVVGGGASGLTSAIKAAKSGCDVLILERNNCIGKKILLTGSGKCNYWNMDQNLEHYHSSNEEYLKDIINIENTEKVKNFFNSIGLIPKIKNGYYYPNSNQAISVNALLLNEIDSLNIKINYNTFVTKIEKIKDKFKVYTENSTFNADKVILTTGSKSYPKTGSDGNGYEIALSFGHTIIPVLPSLTQVYGDQDYYKEWNGIRVDAKLSLYEDNKFIKEETGELHLTNFGLSGICTFNLSGIIAKGLFNNKQEIIYINFLPDFDELTFLSFLDKRNRMMKKRTIDQLFDGLLPYKLFYLMFKLSDINPHSYWNDLDDSKKQKLVSLIIKHPVNIIKTNDFFNAQVCSGGVSLVEINPKTMESLKVRDLYFAGEILDVDGDCGGYNLGFAWISGIIAGESVGHNYD